MTATPLERWLPYRRPAAGCRLRLFCFPYAGGSAAAFRGWGEAMPAGVEVCAVQPPGRERRMAEPPYTRMEPLIEKLAQVLVPLFDRPFAFFGHSLGAKVAFELARRLEDEGRPVPLHLWVSASRAPHMPDPAPPIHALPDNELIAELRRLGGTPDEVLANDELMRLMLPVLRADFELNETYAPVPAVPSVACPITALGGVHDREVPEETVEGWRESTRGPFRRRMIDGGHFFLHDQRACVLEIVAPEVASYL